MLRRACIAVDIDLDPPGYSASDAEDMARIIRRAVNAELGQYNPEVTVIDPGQRDRGEVPVLVLVLVAVVLLFIAWGVA